MLSDPTPPGAADTEVLNSLKAGNEEAFASLVGQYHRHLVYAAQKYVRDPGTAEDVAQDTWIGLLDSLGRFEGRCSLKTWLFRILFNKAQTRASRDGRMVPFSTLATDETSGAWSSVDPSYFKDPDDPVEPGHWISQPPAWKTNPEQIVQDKEALEIVERAIDDLPPAQGTVALLRDVHGLSSKEVCNALGITETNQRVLLHRARTTVRRALSERYGTGI
jgi:RNA polymerase sigma-70 factor (ECF subfamily)